MAENKPLWIDFNAGVLLEGVSIDQLNERFIEYILRVAGGEKVNTEKKNFREISIFKTGVTL
jgi:altronate hydrolase